MRIQKAITNTGMASRREAEVIIQEGRVTINGSVVYHPGTDVDPSKDTILIDGMPIKSEQSPVYFLMYKPKGTITTRNDPQNRRSVYELLEQIPYRMEPIGRLDIQTSGVLLFTNDGALANQLTNPKLDIPKRYLVKVWKTPDARKLQRLKNGINLDDGRTKPAKVRIVEQTDTNNAWIEITVTEERNRLIRRMFDAVGHPANKIKRMSFATISLGDLESGQVRSLNGDEVRRLKDIMNGVDPQNAGHKSRYKKGYARPKPPKNKPLSKKKAKRKIKAPKRR